MPQTACVCSKPAAVLVRPRTRRETWQSEASNPRSPSQMPIGTGDRLCSRISRALHRSWADLTGPIARLAPGPRPPHHHHRQARWASIRARLPKGTPPAQPPERRGTDRRGLKEANMGGRAHRYRVQKQGLGRLEALSLASPMSPGQDIGAAFRPVDGINTHRNQSVQCAQPHAVARDGARPRRELMSFTSVDVILMQAHRISLARRPFNTDGSYGVWMTA